MKTESCLEHNLTITQNILLKYFFTKKNKTMEYSIMAFIINLRDTSEILNTDQEL